MSDDSIELLCTADIHLGRRPSRIPQREDGPRFSPRVIWTSIVERAIEGDVDALLVAGDIVDLENKYYEAYGAFEQGAALLEEEGIPVVVVGGNHDHDTLPRMAEDVDLSNLHIVGRGGRWERFTLEQQGTARLHVDGWSFPQERVLEEPLASYDLEPDPDTPTVGLLHGDLDDSESPYAPLDENDLLSTEHDAWLLGHIHKPGLRRDHDPLVLYPGSPQPLDPGETGAHGPWHITLPADGPPQAHPIPMATLRYDRLAVDASQAKDAKDVPRLVSEHVQNHVDAHVDTNHLQLFLPRIHLQGRTNAHADLIRERHALQEQLECQIGSVPVHVEKLEIDTRPEFDLDALAQGESPVAWLADLLRSLQNEGPRDEHEPLLQACQEKLEEAHAANAYKPLRRSRSFEQPSRGEASRILERQARLLLDKLIDQKEEVP